MYEVIYWLIMTYARPNFPCQCVYDFVRLNVYIVNDLLQDCSISSELAMKTQVLHLAIM